MEWLWFATAITNPSTRFEILATSVYPYIESDAPDFNYMMGFIYYMNDMISWVLPFLLT